MTNMATDPTSLPIFNGGRGDDATTRSALQAPRRAGAHALAGQINPTTHRVPATRPLAPGPGPGPSEGQVVLDLPAAATGAPADSVGAAQEARDHGIRRRRDSPSTVAALAVDQVDGECGADVRDQRATRFRERMRGDDAHPPIRAQPPGVAIAIAHAGGVPSGAHEMHRQSEALAHGTRQGAFHARTRHADREYLVDARRNGGLADNPSQALNAAISSVTALAVAVALGWGPNAVLAVFGAWAILSGLFELLTGARRWRAGAQWAMVLSGAQSALAGGFFIKQAAGAAVPGIVDVAPYAAFGAFYFLVSAAWLRVAIMRDASRTRAA